MKRLLLTLAASIALLPSARAEDAGATNYTEHVKPLLAARCYACHGALKQAGGLRLDTAASLMRGGDSGPAAIARDAEKSLILSRLTAKDIDERMPPEGQGSALKAEEIAVLREWITAGATGPASEQPEADPREHWAFRAPVRPAVPSVKQNAAVRNPIDAFIVAEQEQRGLKMQSPAARSLLLRRVYLDLIGLPPTSAELTAFLADPRDEAYGEAVDRLLASPQYAERWARHWMDIWRFADSSGLNGEVRNSQKHMWHWRDWIVESLGGDLGYDEMLRQMLAADELYPEDLSKLRATGFLARSYYRFNRNTWLENVVEHTGKGLLGVTLNCTRCHDHKFDPFEQRDFYRFRAFFEPYQVRMDQLPGQANYDLDGLPRVFDCHLDAPTYRYIRGDEFQPVKDEPISPGLPAVLTTANVDIAPVALPAAAHQPGVRPWVLENELAKAEAAVKKAQAALAEARKKLPASDSAQIDETAPAEDEAAKAKREAQEKIARATVESAEKELAAAEAEIPSLRARGAADHAKYLEAPDVAKTAAMAAAAAERTANLAKAAAAVARNELELLKAAPVAQKKAEQNLDSARKAFAKAQAELSATDTKYTSLVGAVKAQESSVETPEERARPFPQTSTGRRTALARLLTDRANPLVARVAVNHIWTRHLGRPLVATVFDFGRNGTPPTHPALLDWLAVEFMDGPASGEPGAKPWSMKHVHRLIVTSNTYRLSSSTAGAPESVKLDPDNQYYWRMNAVRLEAQAVRDALLHLAGDLDLTLGGPSIDPGKQEFSRRRSLYFVHSAKDHHRFLSMFDDAKVTECYRRDQNIVPQQALALVNSKQALASSSAIADRIGQEVGKSDEEAFTRAAFLAVLADQPTSDELAACREALSAWRALEQKNARSAARSNLIHALLNHNNFITVK